MVDTVYAGIPQLAIYTKQARAINKKPLPILCISTTAAEFSFLVVNFEEKAVDYKAYYPRPLMFVGMGDRKDEWKKKYADTVTVIYCLMLAQCKKHFSGK